MILAGNLSPHAVKLELVSILRLFNERASDGTLSMYFPVSLISCPAWRQLERSKVELGEALDPHASRGCHKSKIDGTKNRLLGFNFRTL